MDQSGCDIIRKDGLADDRDEDASERSQAFQQLLVENPKLELIGAMATICGINEAEFRVYLTVLDHPHCSIAEIVDILDRDSSTVGKQLKPLLEQDLVERYPRTVDNGGIKYLYEAQSLPETKQWLQHELDAWTDMVFSQFSHLRVN
ncbi:transcriptional regulator [Haladaptatus sp. R4]|uniref:helix-turn-helix domain-containing protein n=1 Tax=Haladaptatus sp. R4 TaxID=1679489 RepID=UPI0007B4A881|nr:helix-turn-helix domain-containing protein [Haladaptatus sp. R4]KZN26041.1 transcriptional regulator [Haladaptatus sp. R4]